MGLFDTIEITGKCSNCDNDIYSWQTKSLEHMLFVYKIGEYVNKKVVGFKDGVIFANAFCKGTNQDGSKCNELIDANIIIKNLKVQGIMVLPVGTDVGKPPDPIEDFLLNKTSILTD